SYRSVRHRGGTCLACFRPALVVNVRRGWVVTLEFSDAFAAPTVRIDKGRKRQEPPSRRCKIESSVGRGQSSDLSQPSNAAATERLTTDDRRLIPCLDRNPTYRR